MYVSLASREQGGLCLNGCMCVCVCGCGGGGGASLSFLQWAPVCCCLSRL